MALADVGNRALLKVRKCHDVGMRGAEAKGRSGDSGDGTSHL
jgi:hypothetical protein